MHIEAIDHVILPVSSLDAATPFERLGLRLTPPMRHANIGTRNRTWYAGGNANLFYVELLSLDEGALAGSGVPNRFFDALREPKGLFTVVLRVVDIQAALDRLRGAGIDAATREVQDGDGRKICDVVPLDVEQRAGASLSLVQYAVSRGEPSSGTSPVEHPFPLKRLDHLAAITPDLETATRFWTDVLGVPVFGEIATQAIIIRQMKIGDAIFELLGPATADSPMRQRPPGLISMVAMEVPSLDAAVQQARAAGFTAPDPATGVLPSTRTASIPAAELSGLTLQLLEYV